MTVFCAAGSGCEHPGEVSAEQRQEHSVSAAPLSNHCFFSRCRFTPRTSADEAAGMAALQTDCCRPELTNQASLETFHQSSAGRALSVHAHVFVRLPFFRRQTGFSRFRHVAIFSAGDAFISAAAAWRCRPVWLLPVSTVGFRCDSYEGLLSPCEACEADHVTRALA